MSNFRILCLVQICTFALVIRNVDAEKTCKEILADLTKRQLSQMAPCIKQLGFTNAKERSSKMNCVFKCALTKEGSLGPDGSANEQVMNAYFEKEFPESLRASIIPHFERCKPIGATLDTSEEYCKSYGPFIKCLMEGSSKMCG